MGNKKIIICCDGTWNNPEQKEVSNVVKVARALRPGGRKGIFSVHYGKTITFRISRRCLSHHKQRHCTVVPIMINNWKRDFVKCDRFIEVFGETNISWDEGIF